MKRVLFLLLAVVAVHGQGQPFDVIIRNGTVLDGSGNPRYDADVAIRNGFIVAIGDLGNATATKVIDARGLFVAPGFINIHSHASPEGLPTAVNMLTQGVTTEIFNADGSGPIDLTVQMTMLGALPPAVNIGAYIGFNAVWSSIVGNADRRPTPEQIQRMRDWIFKGLRAGAWGVSAGLDYKPGYFARTEEVIQVVDVARPFRTNFTNHDRITPESNYSSKVGVSETIAIGMKSGLVPVVTHMKAQGHEQGTADELLASMAQATKRGYYTAADAYPYLAGQSGLGALIIPGWALEGGRPEMLKRFGDPATRAKIIAEAERAMTARFGGPQGVYLPRTGQELTAVMKEMNAEPGETVLRILEQGDPGAILRFGSEEDLIDILKDPVTSMACDCGATVATSGMHPRFYGSYPRVLGRYVREQKIMTWEQAIRKSTWLPAATIGMIDRGLIAPGMAADMAIFNPNTVIDRATYENPAVRSHGIEFVVVNGAVALERGEPTGARAGKALYRATHMPSRALNDGQRQLRVQRTSTETGEFIRIDLTQRRGARQASGTLEAPGFTLDRIGFLETANGWAHVAGIDKLGRVIDVVVDLQNRDSEGPVVIVSIEGEVEYGAAVSADRVRIR
jgi:N-acyl-D-amino-acid deacylase